MRNTVAGILPGEKIEMKIIREGKPMTIKATIGELPTEVQKAPTELKNALKGVTVQDLNPDISRQLQLPAKLRGVVVTDIEEGSPAETTIMPGDVILEINRKATPGVKEYEEVVSKIQPEKDVLILVFRRGATIFVTTGGE